MEIDNYIMDGKFISENFDIIREYSGINFINLCKRKFESFNQIANAINWKRAINYSRTNGAFGNETSKAIISSNLDYIFKNKSKYKTHKPATFDEFIFLVAYDMIDNIKLIEKIILQDSKISISNDESFSFIRDFVAFDPNSNFETRVNDLYKKYTPDDFPTITRYGFENFYWLIQNNLDNAHKLLVRLK